MTKYIIYNIFTCNIMMFLYKFACCYFLILLANIMKYNSHWMTIQINHEYFNPISFLYIHTYL